MLGDVRADWGGHMKSWIVAASLLAAASSASAEEFSGTGRAIDGDSLFVGGREVRLFGIDAPEYRQACRIGWSNWSCGADAAAALRTIIATHQLTCKAVDRDVYGRTVAICRAGAVDLATAMLEKGMAISLDNAPAEYTAAASHSRLSRAGIWASEFEAPAAYRAAHPRGGAAQVAVSTPRYVAASVKINQGAFRNCAEARAAGAAPVRRGQPGYGSHLDGDGDGIACEPYRRR